MEGQVQAEERLPDDLRDGEEAPRGGPIPDGTQQHGDRGITRSGPPMRPNSAMRRPTRPDRYIR